MRGARLSLLLALLLLACVAAHARQPSRCDRLQEYNADRLKEVGWRTVSRHGNKLNVTLYWGSAPARAATALLRALLTHVRLYERVHVSRAPLRTGDLARSVHFDPGAAYHDLVISISTAWEPEAARTWWPGEGAVSGLAGPRLAEFGASPVPARRRLHAWLAPRARAVPLCRQRMRWTLYANATALQLCGFINTTTHYDTLEVVGVGNCSTTLERLRERAAASATSVRTRLVNRTDFVHTLHTANYSFLFLDYDIWKGEPNVTMVEAPACVPSDSDCKQELDSAIAIRVADVDILQTYAPQLFQFVHDFNPTLESLRLILEREALGEDVQEAACAWALESKKYDIDDDDLKKYDQANYTMVTYLCTGDTNNDQYENILRLVGNKILLKKFEGICNIRLRRFFVNCSDNYHMSKRLDEFTKTQGMYKLLGAVSLAVEGAVTASAVAASNGVPLLLADVVPEDDTAAADATWRVAGRPRHIALALRHFVLQSNWSRVAVLTQPTKLATDYYDALKDQVGIIVREFPIPLFLTETKAEEVLQSLRATNSRIIFVNSDSEAAETILAAAVKGHMGYTEGFVWIVREWQPKNVKCGTNHFTVSFWIRGLEDFPTEDRYASLREKLSEIFKDHPWPPHVIALIDALFTLSFGFLDVFRQYPSTRQDLRSAQVIRSLNESLMKTPVIGVDGQLLRYKKRSIEETFVFVDQWCGSEFKERLARWRVHSTNGTVRDKSGAQAECNWPGDLPRDDGKSRCLLRSGDEFDPNCYDTLCACVIVLLALIPVAVLLALRAVQRRLATEKIGVIARRRHVAAVLAAYLVEREALELHEELGAGRFGSVRLARWRAPAQSPRYIAAKALRDNAAPAEESEFLREACTIASLEHKHIVRLVGVCIVDGPPLLLMELAFFGDLLGYLRARRHLAEGVGFSELPTSDEAQHVSAEALTRLAREAAEALQYLSARGVVHRDVRAANCLVDVRRSLKLADFGMARDTVAGADGAPEYACRRRGLFPVLWMAPESLAHGVFSAASDVWAFGVLMLELVTLGARPYGAMSPLRVLEYVAAGGSPPLPQDATPQTRGLARLCWQRSAERRPSAAEVAAYLAAWPLALRPALLSEPDEPADADSGYGESPSTELLPPDSPLHSFDQLEVLAATH